MIHALFRFFGYARIPPEASQLAGRLIWTQTE